MEKGTTKKYLEDFTKSFQPLSSRTELLLLGNAVLKNLR